MALKIKGFELPDGYILEEAYVKVQNILIQNLDYEFLEPDGDDLLTKWVSRLESKANVYVYGDEHARNNRVSPMEWFDIQFDLVSEPFKDAYDKIKQIYPTAEDC